MIDIKGVNDNIILSVSISQDAIKTEELMKQYSITLSWNSITNKELPLGSYIVYDNVRYSLLEPYYPEQRDEATYEYRPVFQHPIMRLSKALMFFYTSANSRELDWTLTDNASNFMSAVCKAIKNEIGEDWTYTVASDLPASATLSFSNNDIFSALNTIAGAFETEWWFEYDTRKLHLSKAKFGNAVVLEVGNNIGIPQISKNKLSYYTRFYVFGSTRNINQNYSGAGVNSIVNRRLTLNPSKYPNGYIDVRSGLTGAEILPTALVFDDIYPRSKMTISDVRVRLMWTLDDKSQKVQIGVTEDGTPVYDQYAIWYFKIPGFTYDKAEMGISGKPLSVHFNTGPLRGREFELYYHNVPYTAESSDGVIFNVEEGDYEIRFIEEGTYIIPAITGLTPVDGNSVTLFNIDMPEEYKLSAYDELESAALNAIEKRSNDYDNYSFDSNKVAFYESNPNLAVGRSVTYINGSQRLNTRVIKLETKLDHPFEQNITIGNAQIKGTQQTLKEEVFSANQNIDLLSAINENTTAFQQALQRTQKAVLESIAKYGDWLGLDENYDLYVREKRIWTINEEGEEVEEIVPRNFWVSGEVSAGGIGQPSEGGGEGDGGFGVVLDAAKLGTVATEDLSQTFSAYAVDSIYKQVQAIIQGGVGGGGGLTKELADTYYAPLDYFNNGIAKKATLLEKAPVLKKYTDTSITVTAGGQESSAFVVPYATTAGSINIDGVYTIWGKEYWKDGKPQSVSGDLDLGDGSLKVGGTAVIEKDTTIKGILHLKSALIGAEGKTLDWYGNIWGYNISPQKDSTYDLGSSDYKWKNAYINNLKIGDAIIYWDDENQCLRTDKSFSSDGEISSGGVGEEGSSGSGFNLLNSWTGSYDDGYALSASLGVDLNSRLNTLSSRVDSLAGGSGGLDTTSLWNELKKDDTSKVIHSSHIPDLSSKYVTLGGTQTITGVKTFNGDIVIKNATITGSLTGSDGVMLDWYGNVWADNISPQKNATYDLGSTDLKWKNAYISSSIFIGGAKLWWDNSEQCLRVDKSFASDGEVSAGGVGEDVDSYQTSDITLKNVIEDVSLSSEVIANTPMFKFTWKDREDDRVFIGTSAQYWVEHAKELTVLVDDKYALDYATLGVLMGKSNATEIEKLKAEVKELRTKVENYEKMLNAN